MLYHSMHSSIMGLSVRKYLKTGISHLLWPGLVPDVLLKAWVTWNVMQQTAEGAKILHWDGSFQDKVSGAESKWLHTLLKTSLSFQDGKWLPLQRPAWTKEKPASQRSQNQTQEIVNQFQFTESKNHKLFWVRKDTQGSSSAWWPQALSLFDTKSRFFMEVVTGFKFFLPLKDYDKAQHQRLYNIIMKLYACGCFSDVLWHFCVFLSPYTLNT